MKLLQKRKWFTPRTTISELYVDGRFECFVLEDVWRPPGALKVPGRTAIPAGTYAVIINRSPRFSALAGRDVLMPLLIGVPGFEGVRIHTGNGADDTEGCLLPGLVREPDRVLQSTPAYRALYAKIEAAQRAKEGVSITIEGEPKRAA